MYTGFESTFKLIYNQIRMSMAIISESDEWEIIEQSSTLPAWVVAEFQARQPEPFTIHATACDGSIPQWVVEEYLARVI